MNTVKKAPRSLTFAALLAVVFAAATSVPGYATESDQASVAVTPAVNHLSDVRYEAFENGTRIVVDASAPLVYTSYSPEPGTLIVDMAATDGSAIPSLLSVGSPEVSEVSVTATTSGPSTRLAIRTASDDAPYFESLDDRLVITFARSLDAPATPVAATEPAQTPVAPATTETTATLSPATTLNAVTAENAAGGLRVLLGGNGSFESYQDFVIQNPERLIIDLKGVTNEFADESITVDNGGVLRVRVAQYQMTPEAITRVVFDLSGDAPYRLEPSGSTLAVVIGSNATASAAPQPVEAVVAEAAPAPAELVELAPVGEESAAEPVAVETTALDAALALPSDVALFETANAALQGDAGTAQRGVVPTSFESKTIGGGEKPYNGKPLSLDFKDADIKDIFRFISDFSGLNVVLDPTVSGKITIKLTEVPWDQALDIILKNNGLGMVYENNVIRIATTQKLATEEANRRRLAEEKELAVPLKTITRALSYSKAADLQKILQKIMSKRGDVLTDKRTNTLIVSDVPDRFDIITNLIDTLDAPTPQVNIETRIVETTRDFSRDLGVQWGFRGISDAAHGNTTNLIFPNNAVIDGSAVNSTNGINGPLGGYAVNLPATQTNSGLGLSFGNVLDTFRLDVALTAFEREGKGRVISAPKVTTQNNEDAEIRSGKQIPITTIANNTVTTIFVDALLSLKVKPQITAEGTVIMDITVDKSQPDFANLVLGTPPIDKREAKTSVLVRDGGTTVIGGIFQVTDQNAQQRTPFLSRIPVLGNLFKNKATTRLNNELLIFVTPRIVKY